MTTQTITNKAKMFTIPALAAEYRDYGISDRAIRRWVSESAFPVVRVGVKVLINQFTFEQFLRGEPLT